MADLDRFIEAQERGHPDFATALAEIRSGGKRSHWIWYVFPQLAGLGHSELSRRYAVADVAEARAYLQNSALRDRLLAIASAVADQARRGRALDAVMGSSIDAAKLVSSLTLFSHVARQLHAEANLEPHRDLAIAAEEILAVASAQGYPRCRFTVDRLGLGPPRVDR